MSGETFGADGFALESERTPVAEGADGVELTFGLVADNGALLLAVGQFLAPLTHLVTFASALIGKLLAVFAAGLSGDIPHAETIAVAVGLARVAVVAARLADSWNLVGRSGPSADVGESSASSLSVDVRAVLATDVGGLIVETVLVVVA